MNTGELITLLELLKKYETEKIDPIIKRDPKTQLEFLATVQASEHKKVVREIYECIAFDL